MSAVSNGRRARRSNAHLHEHGMRVGPHCRFELGVDIPEDCDDGLGYWQIFSKYA